MPTPSLKVSLDAFVEQSRALQNLLPSLMNLSARHRKLVAEIMLVRLCFAIDNCVESSCLKLLCGVSYLDGSGPAVLVTAKSIGGALTLVRNHNRPKPLGVISWTRAKSIRKNMKETLAKNDPLFTCIASHSLLLAELRKVRNHIAHKNTSTAAEFRKVVKAKYGALRRGMTPGLFLLEKPGIGPSRLEAYLISARVFAKELVRG